MIENLKETLYCQLVSLNVENSNIHRDKTKKITFIKRKPTQRARSIEEKNGNNNGDNSIDKLALKAFSFKYISNASLTEIESIRKLLVIRGSQQSFNNDERDFFKSDYDRMMVDDWLVTRFLIRGKKMAAQHDQAGDQDRVYAKTMELIEICAKFRYEYQINASTKEAEFPLDWTKVNGMFHYRHDRVGNPTAYMRVALHRPKLIETAELRHEFKRYMLYVLEQCDQHLFQKPGKAICCVFDMSNATFENIDLELITWMIKSFKNCAPKLLCYVIIYNPPWFFTATFRLICNTLLSNNKRQSIKFACGEEILDYIDHINLPPYLRLALM